MVCTEKRFSYKFNPPLTKHTKTWNMKLDPSGQYNMKNSHQPSRYGKPEFLLSYE
jgi:hypothetical protein